MGEKGGAASLGEMDPEGSEEESDIDKYFESDDEIKENLKTLLNMPLEFMEDSSDDEIEPSSKTKDKPRGDSVERQMEALFVEEGEQKGSLGDAAKDTGFESISENEFDGPESGECDTSDGELPDSPKVVVTLPDTPMLDIESINGDSDGELKMEYHNRSGEYYNTVSQKISVPAKPEREVIVGNIVGLEKQPKVKEKKEIKTKDKSLEKIKNKEKKEKKSKVIETGSLDEEKKKELKIKKYLSKCLEYFFEMSKKNEVNKESKDDTTSDAKKINSAERRRSRLKSIVEKVTKEEDTSPHSSASSRVDRMSLSSQSSGLEKLSQPGELKKRRSASLEKERKLKSSKKSKSKTKELREHKYKYRKYLQYLQAEREKCYKESLALEKQKHKIKRKRRKSESSSPDKNKEKPVIANRSQFLSFPQFCESRELISPDKDVVNGLIVSKQSDDSVNNKERTLSNDPVPSKSNVQCENVDIIDDDKELFITYSDLVEQDKLKNKGKQLEEDKDNIETILETDPELKSISVFTSVLFKGSADSHGIPFLQESRLPSPSQDEMSTKAKTPVTVSTGPDELYDWNDDLSTISQCSLSPSNSPAPKVHNKALLNFLENQKERTASERLKKAQKKVKYSRSRSKSPKKERIKKRKKHRLSKSISHSPPPPRPKSPDIYKKRVSPPAYLKERWKDYPSPPERRREHYDRPPRSRRRSRSRTRLRVSHGHNHRSRSSSEERLLTPPPRRYRSRSRSPPPPAKPPVSRMVHTSGAEKRRLLKEEHERALASLRATIRKPLATTPLSITFSSDGDAYEPIIRDNYDPVVMNEDSSSTHSLPGDTVVPALPPLPPGLPPEPPPGPPPPPITTSANNEDMTLVTTYTSFVPLPNTNIAQPHHPNVPMGYMNTDMHQMPPFNNWGMNPVGDLSGGMQHHMYPPHQMMNSYDQYNAPPPQQSFPFLNQPPPSLPYQMQMPPPCHQHYRMPNQGPPPSINLISVRQEITNIKPNPVVITQVPDNTDTNSPFNFHSASTSHPLETSSKCKHNPLGQNNQTIQEAIDSVKKCLKNCDSVKSKDPRLVTAEMRNRSPERSEVSVSNPLQGLPTAVDHVEPGLDLDSKPSQTNDSITKVKPDKYNEKHFNIEGIVSKLKDTIGTTGNNLKKDDAEQSKNQSQALESSKSPAISQNQDIKKSKDIVKPGDEPYDPFSNCDEPSAGHDKLDITKKEESETTNTILKSETNLFHTPQLCQGEIYRINLEVHNAFSFLLSHTIERKRLTPTFASICAKKLEHQNKSNYDNKTKLSKTIVGENQQNEKDLQQNEIQSSLPHKPVINSVTDDKHSLIIPKEALQECLNEIKQANKVKDNNEKTIEVYKSDSSDTHLNIKKEENPNESIDVTNIKLLSSNEVVTQKDKPSDMISFSNESLSKVQNKNELDKPIGKEESADKETSVPNKHKEENLCSPRMIEDSLAKITTIEQNKEKIGRHENKNKSGDDQSALHKQSKSETLNQSQSPDTKIDIGPISELSSGSKQAKKKSDKKRDQITELINKDVTSETKKIKSDTKNKQDNQLSKSKEMCEAEKRVHPSLSIPTKGELKRFPTPERTLLQTENSPGLEKSETLETVSSKSINRPVSGDSEKLNPKILSSLPKGVVESILDDFEDSNSTGSDFPGATKEKYNKVNEPLTSTSSELGNENDDLPERNVVNKPENLIPNEILVHDSKVPDKEENMKTNTGEKFDQPNLQNVTVVSSENSDSVLGNNGLKTSSKQLQNLADANNFIKDEVVYNVTNKDNSKQDDITNENNNVKSRHSKIDKKNKIINTKPLLSTDLIKYHDSTVVTPNLKTKQVEISTEHSKFTSENFKKMEIKVPANIMDKTKSLNPQCQEIPLLSKTHCRPCPLSKKSKSYISQHLPASFDLSSDAHLIRRGFKILQVRLRREQFCDVALLSLSDERSHDGDAPSVNPSIKHSVGHSTAERYGLKKSISLDNNEINHSSQTLSNEKQTSCSIVRTHKVKQKKKVSFNMTINVNIDPVSDVVVTDSQEPEINKVEDICPQTYVEHSQTNSITNKEVSDEDTPLIIQSDESNKKSYESDQEHSQPVVKLNNDLSTYYENIKNTLVTFRETPLKELRDRKSVSLTIPKEEDMPRAIILDSPKKVSKMRSKKKIDIQETEIDDEKPENMTNIPESRKDLRCRRVFNIKMLDDPENRPTSENNNSRISEQNDNDDSVILDRELSDLAKGCLDSDSTVGGDDDSVLNFGMAGSDDSSVDSDFVLKWKTNSSKSNARQQSKLSSPQSIKRRLSKKCNASHVEAGLKKKEDVDSQNSVDNSTEVSSLPKVNEAHDEELTSNTVLEKDPVGEESLEKRSISEHTQIKNRQSKGTENDSEIQRGRSCNRLRKKIKEHDIVSEEIVECLDKPKLVPNIEDFNATNLTVSLKEHQSSNERNSITSKGKQLLTKDKDLDNNAENEHSSRNKHCERDLDVIENIVSLNKETSEEYNHDEAETKEIITLEMSKGSDLEPIDNKLILKTKTNSENEVELSNTEKTGDNTQVGSQEFSNDSSLRNINKKCNDQHIEDITVEVKKTNISTDSNKNTFKDEININETSKLRRVRKKKMNEVESLLCNDKPENNIDNLSQKYVTEEKVEQCTNKSANKTAHNINKTLEVIKSHQMCQSEDCKTSSQEKKSLKPEMFEEITSPSSYDKVLIIKAQISKEDLDIQQKERDTYISGTTETNKSLDVKELDDNLIENKTLVKNVFIGVKNEEKKVVEKLEADSSTSLEIPLLSKSKRKTRSNKLANKLSDAESNSINPLTIDKTESSFRRTTRNKNKLNEPTFNSGTCKKENNAEVDIKVASGINKTVNFEEDKSDSKTPHYVSRTSSTDSIDEPLISVRNKLLANKQEEIKPQINVKENLVQNENVCSQAEILFQNDDIEEKIKCCATTNKCSGQGNWQDTNNANNVESFQNSGNHSNGSTSNTNSNNLSSESTKSPVQSYPNTNGVSSSDNTNKPPSSNQTMNNNKITDDPKLTGELDDRSLLLQNNYSINPKSKEALRKKRDKAEVDAEIKRRLAEIDELEKLARSQHANLLEKIGARTRSRTSSVNKKNFLEEENEEDDEDVVSISSEDSCNSSIATNDHVISCTNLDVTKCEEISNEEPSTTLKEEEKVTQIVSKNDISFREKTNVDNSLEDNLLKTITDTTKNISKKEFGNDMKESSNSKEISVGGTCDTIDKTINDSDRGKSHLSSSLLTENQSYLSSDTSDNLSTPSRQSKINRSNDVRKQTPLKYDSTEKDSSRNLSSSPEINLKQARRNVISVYQFRESDEDTEPIEQLYNRSQRSKFVSVKKKEIENSPLISSKEAQPSFTEDNKMRKKNRYETMPDKSCDNAQSSQKLPEEAYNLSPTTSIACVVKEKKAEVAIPEPDSSTATFIDICPTTPEVEKSSIDVLSDATKNRVDDQISEESMLSSLSHDSNIVESSPSPVFRKPLKKSWVNRKRRRRPFLKRCLRRSISSGTSVNESDDSNEHADTQSEEAVSSSVSSPQMPSTQMKKKRRRKTVMDLLMEDSMLSVTRDFPMSPNPYLFSSFYKDIDLSNSVKTPCTETSDSGQNSKTTAVDYEPTPKPDILAQKLRLLEKLKSISRKSRKTRQCRTLVCYNEDSLPESLVESPVGEFVSNNGDVAISPQEIVQTKNNSITNEQNTLSEEDQLKPCSNNELCSENTETIKLSSLKKRRQKLRFSKAQLIANSSKKKGVETNLNTQATTTNILSNDLSATSNECFQNTELMLGSSDTSVPNANNSEKKGELSEFDKLLENAPIDAVKPMARFSFDSSIAVSPCEDKSDDVSNDYYDSFPSPLLSDSDNEDLESSEAKISIESVKMSSCVDSNVGTSSELFEPKQTYVLHPEKILCSILRDRVGKMLPYFGDSSDQDDFDEDVPLSVKLSQFEKSVSSQAVPHKQCISSTSKDVSDSTQPNSMIPKRRGRKPKLPHITSSPQCEKKVTRSSGAYVPLQGDCDSTKTNTVNKIETDCTRSTFLNVDSPSQVLRKSTRKAKSLLDSSGEKTDDPILNLNTSNNEKESNINAALVDGQPITESLVPVRRRGRPSNKLKLLLKENTNSVLDKQLKTGNEVEGENNLLNKSKENDLSTSSVNENSSIFIKKRLRTSLIETQIKVDDANQIKISDEIKQQKEDLDSTNGSFRSNNDSPRLEISDLDSAIQKSIALRKNKIKSPKQKDNQMNLDEMDSDHENVFFSKTRASVSMENLQPNKESPLYNGESVKLRGKRKKQLGLNKKKLYASNYDNCISVESKNDVRKVEITQATNEESTLLKPSIDLPPSLVKTRLRRQKVCALDNANLEPPNLEAPFNSTVDSKSSEVTKCVESEKDSFKEINEEHMGIAPKSPESKSNDEQDSSKHLVENNSEPLTPEQNKCSSAVEITEALASSLTDNSGVVEEKQIPRRKRGRKSKRKILCKKPCKEINISIPEGDTQYDSEVEISATLEKNTEKSILETEEVNKSDCLTKFPKTVIDDDNYDFCGDKKENEVVMVDSNEIEESKKRKRKTKIKIPKPIPADDFVANVVKDEEPEETDGNMAKKKRPEKNKESENEQLDQNASTSTNNSFKTTCADHFNNQSFLWSKISGFLNKSTRSVGTQVKVKNMTLKGFESSEPEVSLQSELTLPLVIKTLFEELKTLDSSFSNS